MDPAITSANSAKSTTAVTTNDYGDYTAMDFKPKTKLSTFEKNHTAFEYGDYNVPPPALPVNRPPQPPLFGDQRPPRRNATPSDVLDELKSVFSTGERPTGAVFRKHTRPSEESLRYASNENNTRHNMATCPPVFTTANATAINEVHLGNRSPVTSGVAATLVTSTPTTFFGTCRSTPVQFNPYQNLRYAERVVNTNPIVVKTLDEMKRTLNMLVIDVQSQRKKIEEIWRSVENAGEFAASRSRPLSLTPPSSKSKPLLSHCYGRCVFPSCSSLCYTVNDGGKTDASSNKNDKRVSFGETSHRADVVKRGCSKKKRRFLCF